VFRRFESRGNFLEEVGGLPLLLMSAGGILDIKKIVKDDSQLKRLLGKDPYDFALENKDEDAVKVAESLRAHTSSQVMEILQKALRFHQAGVVRAFIAEGKAMDVLAGSGVHTLRTIESALGSGPSAKESLQPDRRPIYNAALVGEQGRCNRD